MRTIVEVVACLLIAFLLVQTWFFEGMIVPCRITSGSMAVTLLGVHRDVVCVDCGYAFSADASFQPTGPRAVCPNCGYANNDLQSLPDLDGDGLLIDRLAYQFRSPRRWEIAAFRRVNETGNILVKRVAGLPGESIEILDGDIYIDGKIQRKTLAQQRSMAVLVYDANHPAALPPVPPPRWQSEDENSLWKSDRGRFMHTSPHPSPLRAPTEGWSGEGIIDWLIYRHWQRSPGQEVGFQVCPITDVMGYNQTLPRREEDIHKVNDLLLSFRLMNTSGRGMFFIRTICGQYVFQVEIDPNAGLFRATINGIEIVPADDRFPRDIKGLEVVVSTIDRQFLLAFDGQTVLCQPMDDPVSQTISTSQPFALGAAGLEVAVEDLQIYRDVYYTHPIGLQGRWALNQPFRLGEHEFFVLGDNSSIAEDSRTWPENPAVMDKLLIGKPLMVLFPVKSAFIGKWHFQVPDPSRIRYIR
ncbi:MAG TPA: S26 family signal peptidase [Thermoguttaceae bacterium]